MMHLAKRRSHPILPVNSMRHSMQPIFETSRLLLRPRTLADTDACFAMDSDPAVIRFVSGPWSDPIAHRSFIEARTRGPYANGLGYWIVCHQGEAASFLGWVLLIPADGTRSEVEIGWRLRQAEWGRGIATEAAAPLLRHAFVTLDLPEVIAEIDPQNHGSQKVAEKLGLRHMGVVSHEGQPGAVLKEGRPARRYSITHEVFVAGLQ
jgi:RimJ/RimL family protein N-acetyltransferase